ncbi:GPI mannosyltransferase 2 [Naematelia encephala]|uniref:GPI mannosyltransferase 2 n=1 Tax=Naematelia encephala TaxID=71784 RepID=A0A1Y2ARW7_9TREE|nr:GPI mannosyltransferase 2 [Naematelia encephala]
MTSRPLYKKRAWSDEHLLISLAVVVRLVTYVLLQLLSRLPAFDTSHRFLSSAKPSATLRWDAIHFASTAVDGYQYEQQLVWQPGWIAAIRAAGEIVRFVRGGNQLEVDDVVLGGEIIANAAFVGATVALYKLSNQLFNPTFARTTALLYILQPSQSVMSSVYTEPLYALFSFVGFDLALRRKWIRASLCLACATSLRATGIFSAGLTGWMILFERKHSSFAGILRKFVLAGMTTSLIVLPFSLFQAYAYHSFCLSPVTDRPWCTSHLPMAYSFVQAEYWNVGLFKYWISAQIPNLLVAAPVLLISLMATYTYMRPLLQFDSGETSRSIWPAEARNRALPFHIHHLALTLLLIFSSHTQIALRVSSGDPVIWWGLSEMAFKWPNPKRDEAVNSQGRAMSFWGKIWVWWVVLWGGVGIVLWAGHYPPA